MWPGFGENCRVLEWIFRRTDVPEGDESLARQSPIGLLPTEDGVNVFGLQDVDMNGLFHLPKDFWLEEIKSIQKYFAEQVNEDLPQPIASELKNLAKRVKNM